MQPSYFIPFAVSTVLATVASIIMAVGEDAVGTFTTAAERWGLWAALTLALVLAMLAGLYKIVNFVLTTLVALVRDNQKCLTKVSETIRDAPCGDNCDWDSDEADETPGGTKKAVDRVRRREQRRERQHPESQPK